VLAVRETAGEAVARARTGQGPTLIEARTYRWRGHVETEKSFLSGKYRDEEEIANWQQRDPVTRLEAALLSAGSASQSELDALHASVDRTVEAAFAAALSDPLPDESTAFEDMFA
jgi:TPP-dependent pyruvate/acetoin dehydrogenase alpha subunit